MILLRVLVMLAGLSVEGNNIDGWSMTFGNSGISVNFTKDSDYECNTTQMVGDVEINWNVKQNSSYYSARPHCLDTKNVYVLRECPKDQNPEPCASTQQTISACPEDYQSTQNHCVKILPEDTYENSKCEFGYSVTFPMKILQLNESIWMPLKRNRDYGIGEFQLDEVLISSDLSELVYRIKSFVDSDCLIYNYHDDTFEAVSCGLKFKRVCAYEKLDVGGYRYCNLMDGNCVNQQYDHTVGKCFCYDCVKPKCKLAEMRIRYQSQILLKDHGQIGLEYGDELVWKSDKEKVNYTNWAYSGLISPQEKDFVSYTRHGWILEIDEPACKICDVTYTILEPEMEIVTVLKDKIVINVENITGFVLQGGGYISCYTDSYKYHLIHFCEVLEDDKKHYAIYPSASGNYWCEAYRLLDFTKVSTGKVFVTMDNIYAIEVDFAYEEWEDPTVSKTAARYVTTLNDFLRKEIGVEVVVKWMKTLLVDEEKLIVTYLLHICVDAQENHVEYFWKLQEGIDAIADWPVWVVRTSKLYNSEFCAEDVTYSRGTKITWPETLGNASRTSKEVCLDVNGAHIFRDCLKHNLEGVRWGVVENCSAVSGSKSKVTDELLELLQFGKNNEEMVHGVIQLTQKPDLLVPIDVFIVSKIFENFHNDSIDLIQLTKAMSNVLALRRNVLDASQIEMNATDRILYNFDVHLMHNQANYVGKLIESRNLYVLPFSPNTNISGLALINLANSYRVVKVYKGTSLEEVAAIPNLQAATILPDGILNAISSEVSVTVFLTDALFAATNHENKVLAKNIAILLPEIKNLTEFTIPILYKPKEKLARRIRKCEFWKYGGDWSLESTPEKFNHENFLLCVYNHTTHFGLLISDRISNFDYILDIATYIGFSFSVLGILGIFITAGLFKNWRQHDGNKVIIHYGAVSIVQIIFLHMAYHYQEYYQKGYCICVGAVLHYTVLCQFMWMLNMAYFMYKRYVQVLQGPKICVFEKACFTSYTIPSVPVIVLLIFFQNYYHEGHVGICYPSEYGLLFAILIPIGVIMAVNVFIFLAIFHELFCRDRMVKDDTFGLRLRLVILVFFMTGGTWGFGLVSLVFHSSVLDFLFCITTSLQGFVLFLFFIVLNENTRVMYAYIWRKYRCYFCSR